MLLCLKTDLLLMYVVFNYTVYGCLRGEGVDYKHKVVSWHL